MGINDKDEDGLTPLHWAAKDGYVEDFIPLVQAGLDINAPDNYGRTPLYLAVQHGHVNCLRPLYVLGANLEIPLTETGETALHCACLHNQPACVEELILLGANINHRNVKGFTPLHQLANVECLTHLIKNKADLDARSDQGLTPLLYAVLSGRYDLAQFFLDQGADPNVTDKYGFSLLHRSLQQSPPDLLEELLKIDSLDGLAQNLYGNTPLHEAFLTGDLRALELLLNKYPAAKDIKNDFGQTPLDLAIANQQDAKIRFLMGHPDFDCTTLRGYGEKTGNLSQNHLNRQFKRYLEIKKRDLSYLSQEGNCGGFSFLFCYYAALGKTTQFKQLQAKMSAWDGTEESLKQAVDVPGLKEPYSDLEELFEQWVNDISWFQHSAEHVKKILLLRQNKIKKLFDVVKPKESSLYLHNSAVLEKQTASWWQEKIALAALYPNINIMYESIDHAMAGGTNESKQLFYDPNSLESFSDILSVEGFPSTLHRKFNISKKFDGSMRIKIPFFSFNPLSSISIDSVPDCPEGELTPFHAAILYNDIKLLEKCCSQHPELINTGDKEKSTPLHYAVQYSSIEASNLLLAHHADVNARDVQGRSPLMIAGLRGAYKIAVQLIESGAVVDLQDATGRTALHIACQGESKIARLLIEKGACVDATDSQGSTPLFFATISGEVECIRLLRSKGANLDFKNNGGNTALHAATSQKIYKSVEALIKHGADINVTNNARQTPLHLAAGMNHQDILKLLLCFKAEINPKDKDLRTPLHYAVLYRAVDCLKELLISRAEVTDDLNDLTPLHSSATLTPTLTALFLQHGINPDLKNKYGVTPLTYAVACGKLENVELLLTYNAKINALNQTEQGLNPSIKGFKSPLMAALLYNRLACFKLLIDKGVDLNIKDWSGETLLHYIARTNTDQMVLYTPFVEYMLKSRQVDVYAHTPFGMNAYHIACKAGNLKLVQMLDNYDQRLRLSLTAQGVAAIHQMSQ